jgi:hypothetical protein
MDEEHIKNREHYKKIMSDPVYREKVRQYNREHYDPEKTREYRKKYLTNHFQDFTKSRLKHANANREKHRCVTYAGRYCKRKSNCEHCGTTEKLQMHHPDYSKPLEFLTLCKDCHEKLHAELDKQGISLKVPLAVFENRHCSTCEKSWPSCGRGHLSRKGRACTLWEEIVKDVKVIGEKNE